MITNFVSRQVSREETRASQARRVTARDMENEEDRPRDIAASIQVIRATATTVLVCSCFCSCSCSCSCSCMFQFLFLYVFRRSFCFCSCSCHWLPLLVSLFSLSPILNVSGHGSKCESVLCIWRSPATASQYPLQTVKKSVIMSWHRMPRYLS